MTGSKRTRVALIVLVTAACVGLAALTRVVVRSIAGHIGYQSAGIIELDPRCIPQESMWMRHPMRNSVEIVTGELNSELLYRKAMQNPEWQQYRKDPPEAYLAELKKNLLVKPGPNSFTVVVTYTDYRTDGRIVAPIVVKSVLAAYKELYLEEPRRELAEKKAREERFSRALDERIHACETEIAQLVHGDGEDLQKTWGEKFAIHTEVQKELRQLQAGLTQKDSVAAVERLQGLAADQKRELDDLSNRNHSVGRIRGEKLQFEEGRRRHRMKIDELAQEIKMSNNVRIVDPGSPAKRVFGGP